MKSQSNVRFSSSVLLIRHETSESDLEGLWYNEKELKRFKRAVRSQARYLLLKNYMDAAKGQDMCVYGLEKIASLDRLKKRRTTNRAILAAQAIIKNNIGTELDSQPATISPELTRYAKHTALKEANLEGLEACETSDYNRFSSLSTMFSISRNVCQFNRGYHVAKKMHYT